MDILLLLLLPPRYNIATFHRAMRWSIWGPGVNDMMMALGETEYVTHEYCNSRMRRFTNLIHQLINDLAYAFTVK